MPSNKRPHDNTGHNNYDNYGSFGNNVSKSASSSNVSWGHPKDAKADFISPSKSHISDKKAKFSTSGFKSESNNNYESWNKAKDNLTADEYNKLRRTNAYINCGEVGHRFSDCPTVK